MGKPQINLFFKGRMGKEILERLLTHPQRNQVQVNFDFKRKIFCFTIPIFTNPKGIPSIVKKYIQSKEKLIFKPHRSFFKLCRGKVIFQQEIPFSLDFQKTLRNQTDQFWKISQSCYQLLFEIAREGLFEDAFSLKHS